MSVATVLARCHPSKWFFHLTQCWLKSKLPENMSEKLCHSLSRRTRSKEELLRKLKRFSRLLVLALAMALWTGQAVAQDDEYLRIYNLIEQADSLSTNQPSAALPKYKEAQAALLNLQRSHRDWNAKVVAFRLNYVVEKIAAVSAKTSKSGGGPGASSSGSMAQVRAPPCECLRVTCRQPPGRRAWRGLIFLPARMMCDGTLATCQRTTRCIRTCGCASI